MYNYCLLAVARLGQLCLATAIQGCNYYACKDNAYYKPSLVEVVNIVIYDAVLGFNVLHEGKPLANDPWILAFSPLVVVSTRITRLEL